MRKPALILLILLCLVTCISAVQAEQNLPFSPPGNVTGNYTFSQGNDLLQINTNFPINSQDVVFPEWLFGMMLVFIFVTICLGLYFITRDPAPWVNVIACGAIIFGVGASAAVMAPLVGYSVVFHQIIPQVGTGGEIVPNSTNTIYVNEVIVYTLGSYMGWACWGLAIGLGFLFLVAGLLLQMKAARKIANQVQDEKIQAGEINFRVRDRN